MSVRPQNQTVVVSNILIDVSESYIELLKAGVPLGSDFLYVFTRNNNFFVQDFAWYNNLSFSCYRHWGSNINMAIIFSSTDYSEIQVLVFVVMIHHVGNSFSTQTTSSAYFNSMVQRSGRGRLFSRSVDLRSYLSQESWRNTAVTCWFNHLKSPCLTLIRSMVYWFTCWTFRINIIAGAAGASRGTILGCFKVVLIEDLGVLCCSAIVPRIAWATGACRGVLWVVSKSLSLKNWES